MPPASTPFSSSDVHIVEITLALYSPNLKGLVQTLLPSKCILQTMQLRYRWDNSNSQILKSPAETRTLVAEAEHKFQ